MNLLCKISLLVALGLVLGHLTPEATGEPLWQRLIPGKRVEADPERDYVMREENGPWMVMATTFSGEGAWDQAHDLVLELRKRYKLEAYLHEMSFDYTDDVQGRGVDQYGQPVRMQYRRSGEFQEIAVLVGNYDRVDSPRAQSTLHKIKYMKPQTLDPNQRGATSQVLAALRTIQVNLLPENDDRRNQGPMRKAFVTRNPMLPREFFAPQGIDPLVAKMNDGVENSLLKCPGKYTVKVATFTGTVVLDQKQVEHYQNGGKMKSRLAQAALNAHKLTLALRHKGYDAYEFHDRYASIVTVGAFDRLGQPRVDGKTELDPQIHTIMRTFGATPTEGQAGGTPQTGYKPKSVARIPLDIQPQLVEVPRASISAAYAN